MRTHTHKYPCMPSVEIIGQLAGVSLLRHLVVPRDPSQVAMPVSKHPYPLSCLIGGLYILNSIEDCKNRVWMDYLLAFIIVPINVI